MATWLTSTTSISRHSSSRDDSQRRVERAQARLVELRLFSAGLLGPVAVQPAFVVIFEGFDAAGKGGAIRRLAGALDPRHFNVVPTGPPTSTERSHHFLWCFQAHMPARGALTILNRSWYGRVLVERVERLIDHDTLERCSMIDQASACPDVFLQCGANRFGQADTLLRGTL
jgi:polyphosphate kinase 2 (PPK2 family)